MHPASATIIAACTNRLMIRDAIDMIQQDDKICVLAAEMRWEHATLWNMQSTMPWPLMSRVKGPSADQPLNPNLVNSVLTRLGV